MVSRRVRAVQLLQSAGYVPARLSHAEKYLLFAKLPCALCGNPVGPAAAGSTECAACAVLDLSA